MGHLRTDSYQVGVGLAAFRAAAYGSLEYYGCIVPSVLDKVNLALKKVGKPGGFTTAQWIEVHNSGMVRFYSAGHPAPVFYCYLENRITTKDAAASNTGLPLGISKYPPNGIVLREQEGFEWQEYQSNDWYLRKGDIMLFTTDGVRELEKNGQLYMDTELEGVLRKNRDLPAREICDRIRESLTSFGNQKDDMSYFLVRMKRE